MVLDFSLYILSFIAIWFGAGLIVSSVEDLSKKLNISSFAVSFFVLGILTSIPEASVGINSIIDGNPEIFVGNLIGASLVLFLLVIPLLAVFGNGIRLAHQLDGKSLLVSLAVVASPVYFILDKKVTPFEGIFLIFLYIILFYLIEKRKGLLEKIQEVTSIRKTHILEDITKIITGSAIVFYASSMIVDKTIYFSGVFNISSYLISLLVLSIGTNMPELSLAVRAITLGKKDIALGDYVGSAAANTLFFGLLSILNRSEVNVSNHYIETFVFTILGLGLFYYFTRSKNDISRREGVILLFVYFMFVLIEIIG